MRVEHLLQWLISATRDDLPDANNWLKVVIIVQEAFRDGTLAKECTWYTFSPITKSKGEFREIGLIEVLWISVTILLNRRFTAVISYHDALHSFRAGRGTGTTALETKLLQ